MNDHHLKTLEQVRAFPDSTRAVEFSLDTKAERYDVIRRTLIRFAYHRLSKPDKGLLLSFMTQVSGYLSNVNYFVRSHCLNSFATEAKLLRQCGQSVILGPP